MTVSEKTLLITVAVLLALVLIIATSCAPADAGPEYDSATVAALDRVRSRLIGPESARFRRVMHRDAVVCGDVSAMNAAREYTGWRAFVVRDEATWIAGVDPDTLAQSCR